MLVVRCAWCNQVKQDDRWVAPDQLYPPDTLTHGICPDCANRVFSEAQFHQEDAPNDNWVSALGWIAGRTASILELSFTLIEI